MRPYHLPITVSGQVYDFPHLEPFVCLFPLHSLGRAGLARPSWGPVLWLVLRLACVARARTGFAAGSLMG